MRVDPYAGQPELISGVDRFDDSDIDLNIWNSPVESGDLTITETGGELKIATTGVTAGFAYLQSKFGWGKYSIIEVSIKVEDGGAAGDGERCEASLNLWKESDVYLKWGVYRDTSEAVNSSAYLRYNDGTGEVAVDCSGAPADNASHAFKLVLFESAIDLYYDSTYVTSFAFNDLINYTYRLEAGNQSDGDIIDIRFDDFKIYNNADPFGTDLTGVEADLDAIIDSLAGGTVSQGTGTLTLTNTDAVALEFTTAAFGSVFELTFIADTSKATTGFEARAAADTIMTVEIYKKIEGAYTSLPQDIWAIQKTTTNTRNIDINLVKCGEDTKIQLQLDKNPSADVAIPYRWIVRKLKT